MDSTTTMIVVGGLAVAAVAAIILLRPQPKPPTPLQQIAGGLIGLLGREAPSDAAEKSKNSGLARVAI